MYNPLFIGVDVGDFTLPTFSIDQNCIDYDQALSQVCGFYLVPDGATKASNWASAASWEDVVENDDITMTKPRYLTGIGSFLPTGKEDVTLSSGRWKEYAERSYQLDFEVLNTHPGHVELMRRFETGWRQWKAWIETVGGRIIGGPDGLKPFIPDGQFPFAKGPTDRERLRLIADFFFT
jgi:hypothetical protein